MKSRLLRFAVAALLVGVVALIPAGLLGEPGLLTAAAAAFGLTLVPALVTLLWVSWTFAASPELMQLAGLGSSMVRLVLTLGGGLVLYFLVDRETFGRAAFWLWLAGFYLVFLILEITLLVRGPGPAKSDARDGQTS